MAAAGSGQRLVPSMVFVSCPFPGVYFLLYFKFQFQKIWPLDGIETQGFTAFRCLLCVGPVWVPGGSLWRDRGLGLCLAALLGCWM